MSTGNGREETSQGKRSATSQTSSEVGSPISAPAKKQRGEGRGGSASIGDELTHSGEHINAKVLKHVRTRKKNSKSTEHKT